MKRFKMYYGNNEISCFRLKSVKQIKPIAKQYPNVEKIVEIKRNPLTKTERDVIIIM